MSEKLINWLEREIERLVDRRATTKLPQMKEFYSKELASLEKRLGEARSAS